MTKAAQLVREFVDRLASQRVVMSVSAYAIGSIIGKGGAVARSLRVCTTVAIITVCLRVSVPVCV